MTKNKRKESYDMPYERYGKEWEKEMMKLSKIQIIDLFRSAMIRHLKVHIKTA